MPYIKQELRTKINVGLDELIDQINHLSTEGNINGLVTFALYSIVKYFYGYTESFDKISDGIKVLECAKLEFARQVLNPYEDKKIKENGDV